MGKEGLGFVPKSMKKKNKTKQPCPLKETFIKAGEGTHEKKNKELGGNAKKSKTARTNIAGDFNPSYVLCRASDGHVYAKFVGSPHEYIEWSIWVLKTLVTNIKGPITKRVPKTKIDLL